MPTISSVTTFRSPSLVVLNLIQLLLQFNNHHFHSVVRLLRSIAFSLPTVASPCNLPSSQQLCSTFYCCVQKSNYSGDSSPIKDESSSSSARSENRFIVVSVRSAPICGDAKHFKELINSLPQNGFIFHRPSIYFAHFLVLLCSCSSVQCGSPVCWLDVYPQIFFIRFAFSCESPSIHNKSHVVILSIIISIIIILARHPLLFSMQQI